MRDGLCVPLEKQVHRVFDMRCIRLWDIHRHPALACGSVARTENILANMYATHPSACRGGVVAFYFMLSMACIVWSWIVRHNVLRESHSRDSLMSIVFIALVVGFYWTIAFSLAWAVRRMTRHAVLCRFLDTLPTNGFCESCLYPATSKVCVEHAWTCPECGTKNTLLQVEGRSV